jgi:hypothetical protein
MQDEICEACSLYKGDIGSYKYMAIKPKAKRPFKRLGIDGDNIKTNLRKMVFKNTNYVV